MIVFGYVFELVRKERAVNFFFVEEQAIYVYFVLP